jgi:KUP system potassium uptake protein
MAQNLAQDVVSPKSDPGHDAPSHHGHGKSSFAALTLGSIGVVYGDIGTSPLYALRESLAHTKATGVGENDILGIISLLIWALFIVVTLKYVLF